MYVIFWSIYLHFAVFVEDKNMFEKPIICLSRVDEKWSAGAFADNKKRNMRWAKKYSQILKKESGLVKSMYNVHVRDQQMNMESVGFKGKK